MRAKKTDGPNRENITAPISGSVFWPTSAKTRPVGQERCTRSVITARHATGNVAVRKVPVGSPDVTRNQERRNIPGPTGGSG